MSVLSCSLAVSISSLDVRLGCTVRTDISSVSERQWGPPRDRQHCFSRRHRRHPSAGEGSRAAARLLVPARQRQHPLRTCRRSSAATATSARLPAEERWCRRRRARRAPTVGGSGRHPALRHRPPTRRGRRLALHCRPPTRCRAAAQIAARVQPKPRPPPPPPHPGAPPTAGPSHRRSAAAPSTGAAASYPLGSHGRLLPARLSLAFRVSRAVVGGGAATGGGGGQAAAARRPARVHSLWTQFHNFTVSHLSQFQNSQTCERGNSNYHVRIRFYFRVACLRYVHWPVPQTISEWISCQFRD